MENTRMFLSYPFPGSSMTMAQRVAAIAMTLRCRTGKAHAMAVGLLTLAVLALPAFASHSMLNLNFAQPVDETGMVFYAARETARIAGDPDRFKIKGDLWIDNNGVDDLEVDKVTISFPGSSAPTKEAPPVKPVTLEAGDTGRVIFDHGLDVALPVPLPPTINIEVAFVGDSHTFDVSFALELYKNDTHTGGRIFPMAAEDLLPGEFWHYSSRHVDDGHTGRDRYGYDFGVVEWRNGGYTRLRADSEGNKLDGTQNDHYLVFGKPVYAVDDGVVVACARGNVDKAPCLNDEERCKNGGGGNELWIQHGDEVVRYSHFKQGSMPPELCPIVNSMPQDVESQNIEVSAGQKIGEIGNSGQTTGPHLHTSVHYRADRTQELDTGFETADARPFGFYNIRIGSHPTHINHLGSNPTLRSSHGPILPSQSLIFPNPCGLEFPEPGGSEISHHGIHETCYQDIYNLVVSSGYRPIFVDGYEAAGQIYFNATFRDSGPAWVARHGMKGNEYQTFFNDMDALGFRLQQVDSYRDGGEVRYAAIFVNQPGPAFAAFHGLDDDEYAIELEALASNGFVPVNISAVALGGQLYWTGLFEQVPVTTWGLETVPASQYKSVFDSHVDDGEIPIYVNGISTGAGAYLTGIWINPVGGATAARHGLTYGDYQNDFNSNMAAGRLTRAVSGYDDGSGTQRFAAVWRGHPDTEITATPPAITNQSGATFDFHADNPFTTLECGLDLGGFGPCTSPQTYLSLSEGEHTFRARAVDRELLRDHTPAQFTWLVDLTPPEVEIVLPEENTKTVHGELKDELVEIATIIGWGTIAAAATDALSGIDTVEFLVDGNPVPSGDVVSRAGSDVWQFRFEPHEKGQQVYQVSVTATDKAGNTASDTMEIVGVGTGKKPK